MTDLENRKEAFLKALTELTKEHFIQIKGNYYYDRATYDLVSIDYIPPDCQYVIKDGRIILARITKVPQPDKIVIDEEF